MDYQKTKQAAQVFRAINHPLRQQILNHLQASPGITVTDLYKKLSLEQSVASMQLAILRKVGVVRPVRAGKQVCYQVNTDRLHDIENAAEWLIR